MAMVIVTSSFGQKNLPTESRQKKSIIKEYPINLDQQNHSDPMVRTDDHYFKIVPAIQGSKKEVENDTLSIQEIDSRQYMYDNVTKVFVVTFEDDNVCYYGNEEMQLKEFIYDKCYECIDNGNNLYCEIYYYYDKNDNRLSNFEKGNLADLEKEKEREIKNYKESCNDVKAIAGLPLSEMQKSINRYTADYQSSLKDYERRRNEIIRDHINIELRRASYVRNIIYKSYPAKIKYIRVTDIKQKNKITIVISNYKDEYRKN